MVCEPTYESCTNCRSDCGVCPSTTCIQIVTCDFGCIDFAGGGGGGGPPSFSLTCIADCVAMGCADIRFFVDQVVNCAVSHLGECSDLACVQRVCGDEITACLGARCPPGM